jgi:hypothetical protein
VTAAKAQAGAKVKAKVMAKPKAALKAVAKPEAVAKPKRPRKGALATIMVFIETIARLVAEAR